MVSKFILLHEMRTFSKPWVVKKDNEAHLTCFSGGVFIMVYHNIYSSGFEAMT